MSDRYAARIFIGGDMPRALLDDFLEQLRDSGAGPEWDGGFEGTDEASLEPLKLPEGFLSLMNSEARYGCFSELEEWLTDNNIPFDRESHSYYDSDAGIRRFRPSEGVCDLYATNDGMPLVPMDEVVIIRERLRAGNIYAALARIDKLLDGVITTPLPKFQLT
jgi:hypothetical protein